MHIVPVNNYQSPLQGVYLSRAFIIFRASIPAGLTKVFEKETVFTLSGLQ